MDYIVSFILTLTVFWFIIRLSSKQYGKNVNNIVYSQSVIHNIIKDFLPLNAVKKTSITQLDKHISKNMTKIIVVEGGAYWIAENQFYVADMQNGQIVSETARIVDTYDMSKKDVDKMLFILDTLRGEGNNDNRNSRDS
jgi:hypothetical protein